MSQRRRQLRKSDYEALIFFKIVNALISVSLWDQAKIKGKLGYHLISDSILRLFYVTPTLSN